MAGKKALSPLEIMEKTVTVYVVDGVEFRNLPDAKHAVLYEEVMRLIGSGHDSLNVYDLSINEVAEWIANHIEDLVALRDRLG